MSIIDRVALFLRLKRAEPPAAPVLVAPNAHQCDFAKYSPMVRAWLCACGARSYDDAAANRCRAHRRCFSD